MNSIKVKIPSFEILLISLGILLDFFLLFGNEIWKIIFTFLILFIRIWINKLCNIKGRLCNPFLKFIPIDFFKERMRSYTFGVLRDSIFRIWEEKHPNQLYKMRINLRFWFEFRFVFYDMSENIERVIVWVDKRKLSKDKSISNNS